VHAETGSQVSPVSTTPLPQTAQALDELQPPGQLVGVEVMHWPVLLQVGAWVSKPAAQTGPVPQLAPIFILQPLTPSQVPSWQLARVVPQVESVTPVFFWMHPDPSLLQA
jgi:hypothetical protein